MSHLIPPRKLLREFEAVSRTRRVTPTKFIESHCQKISNSTQLQILAVDMELALQQGQSPDLAEYQSNGFAHLKSELDQVYSETLETFQAEFCPLRLAMGSIPFQYGPYEVIREIGRGCAGVVYEAFDSKLNRRVVIKTFFLERDRVLAKARMLSGLRHPGICRVYDADLIADVPMMTMQIVDGQPISDWITESQISPLQAVELICKVAHALIDAHENGIAHLNLKPSNIFVKEDGTPVLTDFVLPGRNTRHQATILEVPSFFAPEQLADDTIEDPFLCDVYSLGAVLHETLTGRRVFGGAAEHVAYQIQNEPPRRIRDYRDDVCPKLEEICLQAMEKTASNRFGSMMEFFATLADWLVVSRSGLGTNSLPMYF